MRFRVIGWGGLAGAMALAALFASDLLGLRLDYMGFSDDNATTRILREYRGDVIVDQLALLAVMVIAGVALGAVGATIGWARTSARGGGDGYGRAHALRWGLAGALVGHALLLMRHLVLYPQLYGEAAYDRGGWRRVLMVALTRNTRPATFVVVAGVLVVWLLPRAVWQGGWSRATGLARALGPRARRARTLLVSLLVLAAAFGLARVLRGRSHGGAQRPSVLFIAVDSLRADRVFGPTVRRFPTLSLLAARSARLREAHVTVPRTFPSFVTLLTGRYPHHHGIRQMFPSAAEREAIMTSGPTLPARLAAAGYDTAVVSDYAGEIFSRTPLGFRAVDAPRFDMHTIVALRGLEIHPNALPYAAGLFEPLFPWVRAMSERADPSLLGDRALSALQPLIEHEREGRPFFATVFFSTPHFPYAAPYPYYERFVDPLYEGAFLYDKPPLSPAAVGPADARHIQALYDGAIAAVDAQLARLFAALEEGGVADRTIVVLLADHGENLWEDPRAGMGHGDHLIGERTTHVPLLIYDPRATWSRDIDAITRDIDVAPTLAAMCGERFEGDGVDLGPLLRGEQRDLELPAFSETEYWFVPTGPGFAADERIPYPAVTGATDLAADGDIYMRAEIEPVVIAAKHRALRLGAWKLVYRPTRNGARLSLYDLSRDPDEHEDVSARFPERLQLMSDRLYGWMLDDPGVVRRGDFVVPR